MANVQGSTFLLSAADVTWVRREGTCIDVTTAAAANDGTYFLIDAPDSHGGNNQEFYVWFDLDGISTDPSIASRTGISVTTATGETADQVATALAAALDGNANFRAKVDSADSSVVLIKPTYGGPVDQVTTDGDTTFDFVQTASGLGGPLGKTSGGVEVSMEAQSATIQSDQTGALILDEVFTGSSVECTMSLLEMTPDRWQALVGSVTGDTFTPGGGSELTGYGESRLYESFFDLGGQLILHPTRKDASDRSYDITFWKSAPKPSSINFSGEEPQVMEITFTALADRGVNSAINLMAFGDHDQDVFV
jgi:hypothetical protein